MKVFYEYLEEAYVKETSLTDVHVKMYILPYIAKLIECGNWDEEDLLLLTESPIPTGVQDYFATEFERCPVCNEWQRKSEMVQSRFDYLVDVCEGCRENGN